MAPGMCRGTCSYFVSGEVLCVYWSTLVLTSGYILVGNIDRDMVANTSARRTAKLCYCITNFLHGSYSVDGEALALFTEYVAPWHILIYCVM